MKSAARRASGSLVGGTATARLLNRHTVEGLLVAAISGGLFWLVWVYGSGLRDPRYLDGWMLAAGMAVQLYFHIAIKTKSLPPKSAMRWRKIHIVLGYLLIVAFVSHSDFSLPDTLFEWVMWAGFILVSLSGVFGTYLAWSMKAKRGIEEGIGYDRILARRAELARDIRFAVAKTETDAAALALPGPPYEAWIMDLYTNHLQKFFKAPRNFAAHFIASQRPLKRLTDEIDNLSRYVDKQSQDKLAAIKSMVIEKDQLDFTFVHLSLTRGWLFVHVPVTYSLIVMTVLHILIVYSFSSGAW